MEDSRENLREELSNLTRFNLTLRHVSVIVENAGRKGISNEESAHDFVSAVIEYERRQTPQPRV